MTTPPAGWFKSIRRVLSIASAPEHSKRTAAYRIDWAGAGTQVYYGDTLVFRAT